MRSTNLNKKCNNSKKNITLAKQGDHLPGIIRDFFFRVEKSGTFEEKPGKMREF